MLVLTNLAPMGLELIDGGHDADIAGIAGVELNFVVGARVVHQRDGSVTISEARTELSFLSFLC